MSRYICTKTLYMENSGQIIGYPDRVSNEIAFLEGKEYEEVDENRSIIGEVLGNGEVAISLRDEDGIGHIVSGRDWLKHFIKVD